MANATKKETRRQVRLERRAQEEAKRRRSRQARQLWIVGGTVVLVALVGFVVWNSTRPESTTSSPTPAQPGAQPATGQSTQPGAAPPKPEIVSVPDQGRTHVAPGQSHPPYNSNPPVSGWHYPSTAAWGFHNSELPDELLIHNLEHGGIWITYKDDQGSEVVDPLVALAREFPRKLVITHRPKNDSPLAVAAWGRLMKLDRYDRAAIVDFYNRFKNKGPEFVPD
ncbi:MAG TPA: DUF3105 domain-containing protein [bacterium]|nr:DUF3105 domain-containing protein [bacterium]